MSSERMMARIGAQTESLADVLRHQNGEGREALTRAAQLLLSRPQVVITGMGASFYAALPLETQLCGQGIDAVAVEAGELLHYRHPPYRDAAVLVVSRSGESIEITRLLELMQGRQAVVGVTNSPQSTLAREAEAAIHIASRQDDIVALQTYTGTLLTLALLGGAMAGALPQMSAEAEELLPRFDQVVQASLQHYREWDRFLRLDAPLYLLARGASSASALEGALLFHEVAKRPAVAMPTASFRHGPVEVVDESFRAIVFAPEDPVQELNLSLARDVARFGGQVRALGPLRGRAGDVPAIELPGTAPVLAPLVEIVPVQAAALRMAEMHGIVPGSFRFAPQVALDESSFGAGAAS